MTFPQLNAASKLNSLIGRIVKSSDPTAEFKKSVSINRFGAVMTAKLRSRLQIEENIIIPKAGEDISCNAPKTWIKDPSRNFIEKRLKKWTLIRDNLNKMDTILADYTTVRRTKFTMLFLLFLFTFVEESRSKRKFKKEEPVLNEIINKNSFYNTSINVIAKK